MAMGNGCPAALAARSAAIGPCHLRAGAGLVDEEEPRWIQRILPGEEGLPSDLYVVPLLLGRVAGLFFRVMAWRTKNSCTTERAGR